MPCFSENPYRTNMVDKEKTKGWIHCRAIIEVLGRPKEYVDEVVRQVVDTLKKDSAHLEILKDTYAEPQAVEKLFSTFVEIEFLIKDMLTLESMIFSYMPSSLEILGPSDLGINLQDANLFFNDISARLHEYDGQAKRLKITNIMLSEKLKEYEAKYGKLEEAKESSEKKVEAKKEDKEDKDSKK